MEQYDEALGATNTALNSAGSGYRENAEYLKSFEAQINMVKNSWTEAIIAMKDSGLGDAMILGLQTGLEFFRAMTKIIDIFGVFPTVIGAAGLALVGLSDRAVRFFTGIHNSSIELGKTAVEATRFSTSLGRVASSASATVPPINTMSTATLRASTNFKQLSSSTVATTNAQRLLATQLGATASAASAARAPLMATNALLRTLSTTVLPIAGFMALGGAISFVTGKISESKREQEEMNRAVEEYREQNIGAFSKHGEEIENLIEKYKELNIARDDNDWSNEKEEEYLEITQELATLMPSLVSEIDSKGRAHLLSAEDIDKEIKAVKELFEAEQSLRMLHIQDEYKEKIDSIDSYIKKAEELEKLANSSIATRSRKGMSIEDIQRENADALIKAEQYRILAEQQGRQLGGLFADSFALEVQTSGEKIAPALESEFSKLMSSLDFTGLDDSALNSLRASFKELSVEMDKAFTNADRGGFKNLSEELEALLLDASFTKDEISELIPEFDEVREKTDSWKASLEESGKMVDEYGNEIDELGQSAEETAIYMDGLEDSIYELSDTMDLLSGVTQQHIDDSDDLLWQYELLENQLELMEEGSREYEQATVDLAIIKNQLLDLYPHLFDAGVNSLNMSEAQIDMIRQEIEANDVYRAALKASRDGKLSADEDSALSELERANSNIKSINAEIQALQHLANAYTAIFERRQAEFKTMQESGVTITDAHMSMFIEERNTMHRLNKELGLQEASLAEWTFKRSQAVETLSSSESVLNNTTSRGSKAAREKEKAQKSSTKATKDAQKEAEKYNKEIERSIYLADAYRRATELLNLEMARVQQEKDRTTKSSIEYQKQMEKELDLLMREKELIKERAAEIKNQIQTGTVVKTGVVTSTADTASGSSAQATTWNFFKSKGLSDNAVAGIMGNIQQESNFNSKSVNSSSGASGIFQWLGSRKQELQNYAKQIGKSWDDLNVQLEFAWKELNGSERRSLESLKKGMTASKHASEFERLFERSGGSQVSKRQNYANNYYSQFAGNTQTQSGNSIADYYLGNTFRLSSGFGPRNTGIPGASRNHMGIDLAAKEGTDIKALRGGKVVASYYHNAQGNVIRIEQDDGVVAQYQHMQGLSPLKVGQSVGAGQSIGKVGKTGVASGAHLHLEITQNGKKVDPKTYLDEQGKAITSSTKEFAEHAQSMDELKSQWNQASLDILSKNQEIREAQMELIDSVGQRLQGLRGQYDKFIENSENRLLGLTESSESYRNELDRQRNALEIKQKYNRSEYNYYKELIDSGTMSESVVAELTERLHQLGLESNELKQALQDLSFRELTSSMKEFSDSLEEMNFEIERSKAVLGLLTEGSADYIVEAEKILGLYKDERDEILKKRNALQQMLLTQNLSLEQMEEVNKQLRELSLQYYNVLGSIKDMEDVIENSSVNAAGDVADKLINAYKRYIEEKRDMHMKSIDEEMKTEDKRHKKAMDNLRDELESFRKYAQEKIRDIDRSESERGYNKEIEALENERAEIDRKINLLALDDSYEAKAERKKLQDELARIDEDIAEKQHQREIDLRKEGINDAIEDKEDQIKKEEDMENERYEEEKDRIDKLKKYWEQHYTDLLNDERRFAQIKKDIVAGNFDALSDEFLKYIQQMEDTMPELENTLDGTMQAVGLSIRKNIIEELKEALGLLESFQEGQQEGSGGGDGGYGSELSEADMKVLTGKYINDVLASQEDDFEKQKEMRAQGHKIAQEGREAGSTIRADMDYNTLFSALTDTQREQLLGFINSSVQDLPDDLEIKDDIATPESMELTGADMKVLMGKLMREKMAMPDVESSQFRRGTIRERGSELAREGRAEGSTVPDDKSYDSIVGGLDKQNLGKLGAYMQANGSSYFITDYLQDYMNKESRKLINSAARAESGGYTGAFSGEKIGILHEKELILNKLQTERFFAAVPILEELGRVLKPVKAPVSNVSNNSQPVDQSVSIEVFIEKMTGNQRDLDSLTREINDKLKREKGGL